MLHQTISSNCVLVLVEVSVQSWKSAVDHVTAPYFSLQDYSHLYDAVIILIPLICSSERIE